MDAASGERRSKIRFGRFELDLQRRTLTSNGTALKLQNQPFQLLELLLQRAPHIVSREEITSRIWGDIVHVDASQSIGFCIRQIRSVLDDNASAPQFIETLPRQGYRFIGSLEKENGDQPAWEEPPSPSAAESSPKRKSRFAKKAAWAAAATAALAGIAFYSFVKRNAVLEVVHVSTSSTFGGDQTEPALSPDDGQMAFAWDGGKGGLHHIYVVALGAQNPIRLTQSKFDETQPIWSPDGKFIAFMRWLAADQADIVMIPAFGGAERFLAQSQINWKLASAERYLAWTADSKFLCFNNQDSPSGHASLFLVSTATGEVKPLFAKRGTGEGDTSPAFSPDGRWLSFSHFIGPHVHELLLQQLSPNLTAVGKPVKVLEAGIKPRSPVWMPDSKRILFLNELGLVETDISVKRAKVIYPAAQSLYGLSVSSSGHRLITREEDGDVDIWAVPLGIKGLTAAGEPTRVVHSSGGNTWPSYSPDGRSLAFASWRTGTGEMWVAATNGQNARQVTHMAAPSAGDPRWSPDSRFLAFHAWLPDVAQIHIVRVEDGFTRQLTSGAQDSVTPSWSLDGKAVLFCRAWNAKNRLHRIPVQGGEPQQLVDVESAFPVEVPKRGLMLYGRNDRNGIFARSLANDPLTNPEWKLVDDYHLPSGGFTPVNDGFYYVGFHKSGEPRAFRFYSFATRKATDIAPIRSPIGMGLSVSCDRRHLAYTGVTPRGRSFVQLEIR